MARRVYTQRMQEVLEPVAQSISTLISRIEESSQDGVVLSDLTGPSAAVLAACKGLSNAGRSLCDGTDPILDKNMPPAADSLDSSATSLHEAAIVLKSDPRNNNARDKLMGGARGILDGTTLVLEVFDDQIVRRIVAAANGVLDSAKEMPSAASVPDLVAAVKKYNGRALDLARRTDSRCKELAEDQYRDEVAAANNTIRRACPTLIVACKAKVTCPGDVDAAKSAQSLAEQIAKAAERIRYLVQLKFYRDADLYVDPVAGSALAPTNNAFKLLAQAMVGQPIDTDRLGKDLKAFLDGCEKIAGVCSDPAQRKALMDSIGQAKQTLEAFNKAAAHFKANPNDPEAKSAYEAAAKELNDEVAALRAHALRVLAAEKERALAQNAVTAGALLDAAKAGDAAATASHALALAADAKELAAVTDAALPFVGDAGKARAVQLAAQAVQSGAPLLCSAAKAAAANKDDANAQDLAGIVHQDYMDRVDRLGQAMDAALPSSQWSAAANEHALLAAIPVVKTAVDKQDLPAYTAAMGGIAERVRRMAKQCESEADNFSDKALADAMWKSAKDLKAAAEQYKNAANAYYKDPKSVEARSGLDASGAALAAAATAARKAIGGDSVAEMQSKAKAAEVERQQRREEARRKKEEEARNAELKRKREEEERKQREAAEKARVAELERLAAEKAIKLVEEEEKLKFKDNEMGLAAQELHKEANQWDESDNSVVSLARTIAQMFNRMAEISEDPSSKRELIDLAKRIADAAKSTSKLAMQFANNCADARLKRDLVTTVSQIDTISAQLKIIAAVKAANYSDEEADEQLTCCARNLMAAVQACVGQCHSASIKPINKDDPVLRTVQWRKKVYRNRPDAKW